MNRRAAMIVVTVVALLAAAACEPAAGPVATSRPATPAPTTATAAPNASSVSSANPSSAGPSAVAGKPQVAVAGKDVTVVGTGSALDTPTFPLSGNTLLKLSECKATNGTFPFTWVYGEFTGLVGQYVEEINHLKKLKDGNYYLVVSTNPTCAWKITLTPE